jgi:predicted lipid-binding transport protein (Tim44 family)
VAHPNPKREQIKKKPSRFLITKRKRIPVALACVNGVQRVFYAFLGAMAAILVSALMNITSWPNFLFGVIKIMLFLSVLAIAVELLRRKFQPPEMVEIECVAPVNTKNGVPRS